MAIYELHRLVNTDDLSQLLGDFKRRWGRMPASIAVARSLAEQIGPMPGGIPVTVNGGCLINEIWLEVSDDDSDPRQDEQKGDR